MGGGSLGDRKVIRREEFSGPASSMDDFVEDARHVLEDPRTTARRLFEEGRHAGYEAGFEAGRREWVHATQDAVDAVRNKLFHLEPHIVPVVKAALAKILGELHEDDLVRHIVREALTEVGAGIAVTVRANPVEIEAIRSAIEDSFFSDHLEFPQIRQFEPDASLKKGELVLESVQGRVHVGVDYQLNRINTGLDAAV